MARAEIITHIRVDTAMNKLKNLLFLGLLFSTPALAYDWHDGQGSSYGNDFERRLNAERNEERGERFKESWDRQSHGLHHGGYDD